MVHEYIYPPSPLTLSDSLGTTAIFGFGKGETDPAARIRLRHAGKTMEDTFDLAHYTVAEGSTLMLALRKEEETPVVVETVLGKRILVDIETKEQVSDLIRRIQDKEGIPPDQMHLLFRVKAGTPKAEDAAGQDWFKRIDQPGPMRGNFKAETRAAMVEHPLLEAEPSDSLAEIFAAAADEKTPHAFLVLRLRSSTPLNAPRPDTSSKQQSTSCCALQ
jgi:hypothetical protein